MIAILLKTLAVFGTKLFMSFATEPMIEQLFFHVAQKVVESTKTTQDDEFLKKLEDIYYKKQK